jgi:hypothetical protein
MDPPFAGETVISGARSECNPSPTSAKSGRSRAVTAPTSPPEYRHLRAFGIARVAGGIVAAGVRFACLSYAAYGWAAFFLVIAALDLPAGYWELTIARRPQT